MTTPTVTETPASLEPVVVPLLGASSELGVKVAAADGLGPVAYQRFAAAEPDAQLAQLVDGQVDRWDRRSGGARRASSVGPRRPTAVETAAVAGIPVA